MSFFIGKEEEKCMKEVYRIIFGLQYESWEIRMEVPDKEIFVSQKEAEETVEQADAVGFLTETGIYLLYGNNVYEIVEKENILCEFYQMKPELFERLGPPLGPEDINQLIKEDKLEETIFSSRYMITENDFEKRRLSTQELFYEILQKYSPTGFPSLPEYPEKKGKPCYVFESIWYQVERS